MSFIIYRKRQKRSPKVLPEPYGRLPDKTEDLKYPINDISLNRFGFDKVVHGGDYRSYHRYLTINGKRTIRQRGFLIGQKVDFPACVMTSSTLHNGCYQVIDKNGEVVSRATATSHTSARCDDTRYRQYNPTKHMLIADMVDIGTSPWIMSHHFSLSHLPDPGKYKLVGRTDDNKTTSMELWIENCRNATRYMAQLDKQVEENQKQKRRISKFLYKIYQFNDVCILSINI